MGRSSNWYFPSIVGSLGKSLPISDCEVYIIWILGKEGIKRVSEIANDPQFFPKINLSRLLLLDENMKFRMKNIPPNYVKSAKKGIFKGERKPNYSNSAIYVATNTLEKKGLVVTVSRKLPPNAERKVGLTFIGLMLYLQNSVEEDRFERLFISHSRLFPFAHLWKTIETELGKKCFSTLEDTIKNFYALEKINYGKSLDYFRSYHFKFEAFNHKYLDVDLSKLSKSEWAWLLRRESNSPIKLARVENVWNFLKEEKAQILRDSYIAFLAAQDIAEYFNVTNENNEKSLTQLKSEQELADFENREILSNPLFTEERFWGFFLKYSKIKYFFTGMFVYNLLRDQKTQ